MSKWSQVKMHYQIAAKRRDTPYEQFGNQMLNLIEQLESDSELSSLQPSTAVWTLILSVPDVLDQSIHVSWDLTGFHCWLTNMEDKVKTQQVENVLIQVKNFAKHLA